MNMTAFLLFLAIVCLTLIITYFAAKRTKTTSEFYTAGGGLTGVKNGLAIAG
ncbi:cation acetate symporter, partial [Bacillus subtilis]|nr:cation acetate symporter [Bacillus subtilis]